MISCIPILSKASRNPSRVFAKASVRNNEDNFCLIPVIKKWKKFLDPYLLIFLRDLTALIMNYCWPNFMHTVLTKILYISFIVIFKSNPSKNQNRNFLKHIHLYSIRVPQDSSFGLLLFNIYIRDIFYDTDRLDIANYADDNRPYDC